MTDYERIKHECLQRGELWEDPDFLPTQTSVFYHQRPPFDFVWKRAKDIFVNPIFITENCETFDVIPGKLGDKWLVSCLGVLYLSKGLFQRVVPSDQRMDTQYTGVFRFRLWWCGQWQEVLVDDRLPTVNGKLAFLQTSHTGQLWPSLLEKAYAKLHGSYEALKYGTLLDGLADLTSGITESIQIPDFDALSNLLKTTSVVTARCIIADNEENGLEFEMNYRVFKVATVDSAQGTLELVRLQRPLRPGSASPLHLINQTIWKTIPTYERERLIMLTKGTLMLYSDFQNYFNQLEIVHLDSETSTADQMLADKQQWYMKMRQGSWRKGVTAGGCRNHVQFFHINPQIQLILNEPDTVILSLNQHSIMEPKVIGFSIYKLPHFLTEAASSLLFKKLRSTMNSQYVNSRQVSHRCQLDTGAYLIMPTTFEPREEANFSLRVYSTEPVKMMKVLDFAPEMLKNVLIRAPMELGFMQYESVFLQLADEHRTVGVFELQELLDACLPNDYIKSCASLDTCRQIVLSMDKTGIGRISLRDFKDLMCSLKHWQFVFKKHAREKMGVLLGERLRDALREVGFVVPERVMALIVLRYMRKDGMLRFGDFVSAVMHLCRAFNVFNDNTKDSPVPDMLNFNLTKWLKSALMC